VLPTTQVRTGQLPHLGAQLDEWVPDACIGSIAGIRSVTNGLGVDVLMQDPVAQVSGVAGLGHLGPL
jgi:hypothetical protein